MIGLNNNGEVCPKLAATLVSYVDKMPKSRRPNCVIESSLFILLGLPYIAFFCITFCPPLKGTLLLLKTADNHETNAYNFQSENHL